MVWSNTRPRKTIIWKISVKNQQFLYRKDMRLHFIELGSIYLKSLLWYKNHQLNSSGIIYLDPDHYLPGYDRTDVIRGDIVYLNSHGGWLEVINLQRCSLPITVRNCSHHGGHGGPGPMCLRWNGDTELCAATAEARHFLGIISALVSQYWVLLGWTGFYWEPRSIFLELEVTPHYLKCLPYRTGKMKVLPGKNENK